ncbi:MAG: hypothetical protein LBC84_06825 [Prevotellaceae bacterium]|jgi:hypothetical protein|nr:hypothetical protein [Prevotellaceae bacterium]
MKLVQIQEEKKTKVIKETLPMITFYKFGRFSFNPTACEAIGIKSEDRILFFKDDECEEDVYFCVASSGDGYVLKGVKGCCLGYAASVVRQIFKQLKLEKNTSVRYRISTNPVDGKENLYAIFTTKPIPRKGKA